jgi:hypothetical protein
VVRRCGLVWLGVMGRGSGGKAGRKRARAMRLSLGRCVFFMSGILSSRNALELESDMVVSRAWIRDEWQRSLCLDIQSDILYIFCHRTLLFQLHIITIQGHYTKTMKGNHWV